MLTLTERKQFLTNSSSQAFIATCDDENNWVIRMKKERYNGYRLFCELLAGYLGKSLGLNRPTTSLVYVDHEKLSTDLDIMEPFDTSCQIGVGTSFLNNLTPVPKPSNYDKVLFYDNFAEINRQHIESMNNSEENIDQLRGLIFFSKWVGMSDNHKYENLVMVGNDFFFLDFDMAFSLGGEGEEMPEEYEYSAMAVGVPPFTEGLVGSMKDYDKWSEALNNLRLNDALNVIDGVPEEWNIPKAYPEKLLNFLFEKRASFIEMFLKVVQYS